MSAVERPQPDNPAGLRYCWSMGRTFDRVMMLTAYNADRVNISTAIAAVIIFRCYCRTTGTRNKMFVLFTVI